MKLRKSFLIGICIFLAVLMGFSLLTDDLARDYRTASDRQLEEAVRRTAVACYGAEGAYPPSVAYMTEHYGLTYDQDRFIVHYDLFASNVMPEITVLRK